MKGQRFLAIYLIVIALLQSALYLAFFGQTGRDWLFYFDPRIGIDALLTSWSMTSELRAALTTLSEAIRWLSATWLLVLGILLFLRKPVVTVYVICESLLSVASIVFFGVILIANVSPVHGFSVGEMIWPLMVFIGFSAIPLYLGIRAWRRSL